MNASLEQALLLLPRLLTLVIATKPTADFPRSRINLFPGKTLSELMTALRNKFVSDFGNRPPCV